MLITDANAFIDVPTPFKIEASEWTPSGNGSATLVPRGTPDFDDYMEVVVPNDTGDFYLDLTTGGPALFGAIGLWVRWPEGPAKRRSITLHLTSTWSGVRHTRVQNYDTFSNNNLYGPEWKFLNFPLEFSAWQNVGGDSWSLPRDQIRIVCGCIFGQTNQPTLIGPLYYNMRSNPRLIISFDDANDTDFTQAYAYMQPKGIPGCSFVPSASVGGGGNLSLADMATMYANGWDIGVHGSTIWTGNTPAQNQAYLQQEIDYLKANGFPRGALHAAYPLGAYDENLLPALKNVGMRTARSTLGWAFNPKIYSNWYETYGVALNNTETPTGADALALLDQAITEGATMYAYIHKLGDAGAGNWQLTPFQDFIDGVQTRMGQGLEVLTPHQWFMTGGY